jgi:hypothetical protein
VAEAVNKPAADATADAAAPATGAAAAADVPLEARHAPELLSLLGAELADPYPNPTLTLTQPRPCPQPQP